MKILGLEFSSARRSVAVAEANGPDFRVLSRVTEDHPRGSTGMVLLDRALQQATLNPAEINLIALGLGPGSYGGIRSAIAISQGWQLARGTPVIGLSSVDLLAWEAKERHIFGNVTVVIDAQRREVYAACFAISRSDIHLIEPLKILPIGSIDQAHDIVGPGAPQLISRALDIAPSAETLCRLAAGRSDYLPAEQLEPIYLRPTSFVKSPPPRFAD
jgi:tRNA threonylcarbamoyladenosine biosynthesis protein TsaB